MAKWWHVYILRCSDSSLYCGITTNLKHRLEKHNAGLGARYTRARLPVEVVWSSRAQNKSEASRAEFRIKRLSRAEKDALIARPAGDELDYSNPGGGVVMTKAEIVARLAEENKVTKKVAYAMLESLVNTVHAGLKDGGRIRIDGLGTFLTVERKARMGVNPRTRTKMEIPATKAPAFRPAKALKEAVKEVPKKGTKKGK